MDLRNKFILDACCSVKAMWYNKTHPNAVYIDIREEPSGFMKGRRESIKPDYIMDFRQHQVEPNNSQSSYSEYNQVDFTISFAGRKMEANTVRLLADIELENVPKYSNFKVDNFVGGHSFIQEVLTSTVNQGLV